MNIDEQERIDAATRYLKGDRPSDIYRDLNRSEKWFFKWIKRFNAGDDEWYKSQSRAPKNHGTRTADELENVVVTIRQTLMDGSEHESKYLGVGADVIQYRMEQHGFSENEVPSASTIKRMIKKHGMKINKRQRPKRVKSNKRYTLLDPTRINEVHQMDFVGPRFIKGYGAISSLNLIDVVSNQVYIEQFDAKSTDNVMAFLIKYWGNNPIPKYLQVDNGMYFYGSVMHPRKFSRFIRLCLYVGVEVVFIAPGCPWMNGSIESFNSQFGLNFWDKERFVNRDDMNNKSIDLIKQRNELSVWKKRAQVLKMIEPVRMLKNTLTINLNKLPLTSGKIHFSRQVDNAGRINVLNECFKVGEELISEYVWATIDMECTKMIVDYRTQDLNHIVRLKEFNYQINEEIKQFRWVI